MPILYISYFVGCSRSFPLFFSKRGTKKGKGSKTTHTAKWRQC